MKQNFDLILDEVLASEGGYVDHPSDPGGATNMGITHKTLARWRKVTPWFNLPKAEVKALKVDEAKKIYRSLYWNAVKADALPSGVDMIVFDYAVNSGPDRAIRTLQRLVGADVDGQIGPDTLRRVNAVSDLRTLINRYQDDRLRFLKSLSTFPVFGKGWTSRVERVRKTALELGVIAKTEEVVTKPSGGFNWAALIPIIITIITAMFGATRR